MESYVLDKNIGTSEGTIWIEFISFIRDNKKFDGLKALKEQIEKDINEAKNRLGS